MFINCLTIAVLVKSVNHMKSLMLKNNFYAIFLAKTTKKEWKLY